MSFENGLICILKNDNGKTLAEINMFSKKKPFENGVYFLINANIPIGEHGFHIHQTGNLTNGCKTLGPHYNPENKLHGRLNDPNAHAGDLGNINYRTEMVYSNMVTLTEILGRSLVIHSNKDDLGMGSNEESLKTGNSGSRIACGIIGFL